MKIKRLISLMTVCAVFLFLSSCSGKDAVGEKTAGAAFSSEGTDGSLTIDTSGITADVSYYNYDANGTTVQILALRDKDGSVVAVIAAVNGEKITFQCVCGKDAVAKGIRAGDIIRSITAIAGGKGGGKPDSAMGGGNDVSKLNDALSAVERFVSEKL